MTTEPMPTIPPAAERRSLHVYLSHRAHDDWHDFAAAHGVSVSALLEALSNVLDPTAQRTMSETLAWAVQQARVTDSRRRRRGGKTA